jgi:hypothetical protein
MDISRTLGLLREELKQLNEVILVLERVRETASGKRRGRPPKWLIEARRAAKGKLHVVSRSASA